jgi:hypothetical protein
MKDLKSKSESFILICKLSLKNSSVELRTNSLKMNEANQMPNEELKTYDQKHDQSYSGIQLNTVVLQMVISLTKEEAKPIRTFLKVNSCDEIQISMLMCKRSCKYLKIRS